MRQLKIKIGLFIIIVLLTIRCEKLSVMDCECKKTTIPLDVYEFPARPGTSSWTLLSSSQERIDACQIPSEILNSISTEALIETCTNYPLLRELIFSNLSSGGLQSSMNFFLITFNGLVELSERENSGQLLIDKYLTMSPCCLEYSENKGRFINSFSEFEMIIAQEIFIHTLDNYDLIRLLTKSYHCLRQKQKYSQSYSLLFGVNTSALVAARTLNELNFQSFILEIEQNPELKSFIYTSSLPTSEIEIQKVFSKIDFFCSSFLDNY